MHSGSNSDVNTICFSFLLFVILRFQFQKYVYVCKIWSKYKVLSISLKYIVWPKCCLAKPCRHCAYKWLDNVKINTYVKFDRIIPCSSNFMSIFAYWSQKAVMMLSKPSSIIKWCYTCQWFDNNLLTCTCMQNFIKTYHVVQESWVFQLSDQVQTDSHND